MFAVSDLNTVLTLQQTIGSIPHAVIGIVFAARYLIFADLILATWLWHSHKKEKQHAVVEAGWSFLLALLLTTILSHFIGRLRPFLASTDVHLLIPSPLNTSFPSGHTATSFAIAASFLFADKKIGTLAFVFGLIVAFARVTAGVHYPTDILGGIALGLASFLLVREIHSQLAKPDIASAIKHHHHDL